MLLMIFLWITRKHTCTKQALSNEDDIPITGSITTYNKVTGEPFTWKGNVDQLPPILTYENDPDGLKLELSRMDLLPNSANLKLLNRELVKKSPNKVVVGQPELDSICISLVVKLYDWNLKLMTCWKVLMTFWLLSIHVPYWKENTLISKFSMSFTNMYFFLLNSLKHNIFIRVLKAEIHCMLCTWATLNLCWNVLEKIKSL